MGSPVLAIGWQVEKVVHGVLICALFALACLQCRVDLRIPSRATPRGTRL